MEIQMKEKEVQIAGGFGSMSNLVMGSRGADMRPASPLRRSGQGPSQPVSVAELPRDIPREFSAEAQIRTSGSAKMRDSGSLGDPRRRSLSGLNPLPGIDAMDDARASGGSVSQGFDRAAGLEEPITKSGANSVVQGNDLAINEDAPPRSAAAWYKGLGTPLASAGKPNGSAPGSAASQHAGGGTARSGGSAAGRVKTPPELDEAMSSFQSHGEEPRREESSAPRSGGSRKHAGGSAKAPTPPPGSGGQRPSSRGQRPPSGKLSGDP